MALCLSAGIDPNIVHSTPAAATQALIEACLAAPALSNRFAGAALWEPAVGSGALVDALLDALPPGRRPSRIIATDVHPRARATHKPADFLRLDPPADPRAARPRIIITNPPFSLATEFMRVGLRWQAGVPNGMLALFVPLGALAGRERARDIYADRPPTTILAIANRLTIYPDDTPPEERGNSGVIEYCWLLWLNDAEGRPLDAMTAATLGVPHFLCKPAPVPMRKPGRKPGSSKNAKTEVSSAVRAPRKRKNA